MLINGYKPEFQSTKRSKDAKFGQFFISPHPRRTDAQNGLQSIFNITELLYDKLPKPNCQLCLTGGGGGSVQVSSCGKLILQYTNLSIGTTSLKYNCAILGFHVMSQFHWGSTSLKYNSAILGFHVMSQFHWGSTPNRCTVIGGK